MQKIILDFYFIVLLPLLLVALVSLWNSALLFRSAHRAVKAISRYLREHPEETSRFRQELEEDKTRELFSKKLISFSASGVLTLFVLLFVSNGIKLIVIQGVWHVLQLAAFACMGVSAIYSWHYARERRWTEFALAVLAMLLAAAATEHFLHQVINTGRITCPNCEDEDDPNSDF